jgi:hypothetical protein
MYSEMDTDAFLAYAKAHHIAFLQQAEIAALQQRGVPRQQGKAQPPRHRPTLWQRWFFVAAAWASGSPSPAPRTIRG